LGPALFRNSSGLDTVKNNSWLNKCSLKNINRRLVWVSVLWNGIEEYKKRKMSGVLDRKNNSNAMRRGHVKFLDYA
jgi:hypothetical protein